MDQAQQAQELQKVARRFRRGQRGLLRHRDKIVSTEQYKVNVPEGSSGFYFIERFTVDSQMSQLTSLRAMVQNDVREYVPEGEYTRLRRGTTLVMSDTPAEITDHFPFIEAAHGDVLIMGLGLGMCLQAVLRKPEVRTATVIEISTDVIALSAQHYKDMFGERFKLVNADALQWRAPAGVRFDAVWHDIWDYVETKNLDDMKMLHRRFCRRAGWQGSWSRDLIERRMRGGR